MNYFSHQLDGFHNYEIHSSRTADPWNDPRPILDMFQQSVPIPVRVQTSFSPGSRGSRRSNLEDQLELFEGQIVLVEQVNHESRWCFGRLLEVPSLKPGWFPASHCVPLQTITVPSIAPRGLSDNPMQPPPTAGVGVAFAQAGAHRLLVSNLQPG
jgi:hypothetical protein